jgi:hypothetical protein
MVRGPSLVFLHGGFTMAQAKQSSKRKRRNTALPVLGAAGISLAMAGGASATPPAANVSSQDTGPRFTLGEEEIADVSLATFYVFDKENESQLGQDLILAAGRCGRGCGRCGGCRGCGRGCAGCRGCGGGCGGCGWGGGLWLGACLACAGGCGSCWRWSPYYGRWIYACY